MAAICSDAKAIDNIDSQNHPIDGAGQNRENSKTHESGVHAKSEAPTPILQQLHPVAARSCGALMMRLPACSPVVTTIHGHQLW